MRTRLLIRPQRDSRDDAADNAGHCSWLKLETTLPGRLFLPCGSTLRCVRALRGDLIRDSC